MESKMTTTYLAPRDALYHFFTYKDGRVTDHLLPVMRDEECDPGMRNTYDRVLETARQYYVLADGKNSTGSINFFLGHPDCIVGGGALTWGESPERIALLFSKLAVLGHHTVGLVNPCDEEHVESMIMSRLRLAMAPIFLDVKNGKAFGADELIARSGKPSEAQPGILMCTLAR